MEMACGREVNQPSRTCGLKPTLLTYIVPVLVLINLSLEMRFHLLHQTLLLFHADEVVIALVVRRDDDDVARRPQ